MNKTNIPASCCVEVGITPPSKNCTITPSGCYDMFVSFIKSHAVQLGGVGLGIAFVQCVRRRASSGKGERDSTRIPQHYEEGAQPDDNLGEGKLLLVGPEFDQKSKQQMGYTKAARACGVGRYPASAIKRRDKESTLSK
ncbi:hypothetical protein K0M31_001786 [Melipona bicolor]|uniref:Uncharacterized protein n=1 Tax=Melipona bicolor TaxID=60889 RepID=A0AA40GGH3_9HYME|nr:hypothetical protein K0M31_001786 [Melipona bicolor]